MKTFYYYSDYVNNSDKYTKMDFAYLNTVGYNVEQIIEHDYEYINRIKDNDVLYLDETRYYELNKRLNPITKVIIFLYRHHEYLHSTARLNILKNKGINHIILFITTHLDDKTLSSDMPLSFKCYPFINLFSPNAYKLKEKRNTKYNFFNRAINLRRLKIFELIKKEGIELKECYYTFGGKIIQTEFMELPEFKNNPLWRRYKNVNTISEYYKLRSRNDYEIDIDYIMQFEKDFFMYEDSGYLMKKDLVIVNEQTLDSFISVVVESSDDSGYDMRVTEKTIRSWLCKNIFISIQCYGFNKALKRLGVHTFEDLFGLDENWDECDELTRMERFVSMLKLINNMSIKEVETLYNREDVQKRLEDNYNIITNAFNMENIYKEIHNTIQIKTQNKNRFI